MPSICNSKTLTPYQGARHRRGADAASGRWARCGGRTGLTLIPAREVVQVGVGPCRAVSVSGKHCSDGAVVSRSAGAVRLCQGFLRAGLAGDAVNAASQVSLCREWVVGSRGARDG